MLPSFLFIGPTKSGTTWIDAYLRERGDIALPENTKETFYFDKLFERGLEWYESHFPERGNYKICTEVAPSLFAKETAIANVNNSLPNVQVIYILRNPIHRAVSHYFHYLKAGEPNIGFEQMVSKYPDILESGYYYKYICLWQAALGPENTHFLSFDELHDNKEMFCKSLCRILNIPFILPSEKLMTGRLNEAGIPKFRILARLAHSTVTFLRKLGVHKFVNLLKSTGIAKSIYGSKPNKLQTEIITVEARKYQPFFQNDIRQTEQILGINLSKWLE